MNTTYTDLTAAGSCTSCEVTQDHSAYWTPALYFMYDNSTTVMVQQVGGMLAYYLPYLPNITAFPEGFQMVAGNRNLRHFDGPFPDTPLSSWPTNPTDQYFLQQRALGFNCLNYNASAEGSMYRHVFPSKEQLDTQCIDGLRLELAFPSCGTGAIDSPDHKSHVAYPSLVKEGNCPEGFPVHYPFLFYETIWATNAFAGESGQFVLSYGDPVGTGYHGDFMMGWNSQAFLQEALDTCTNSSGQIEDCPLFNIQSDEIAAECTYDVPAAIKDDMPLGPRQGLPVSVPIQYGPQNATKYPVAGLAGATATPISYSAPPATISSAPTLPYSAVDPAKTSTALGGINVSIAAEGVKAAVPVVVTVIGQAPPTTITVKADPSHFSTSIYTNGDNVFEVFYDVTKVEVTATATATAGPDNNQKNRRHFGHHKQRLG